MSLKKFVGMWNKGKDSYKADPPNATLSVLTKDGAKNVVVELLSVDQKGGSVVFKVDALTGRKATEPFGTAAVYIDVTTEFNLPL